MASQNPVYEVESDEDLPLIISSNGKKRVVVDPNVKKSAPTQSNVVDIGIVAANGEDRPTKTIEGIEQLAMADAVESVKPVMLTSKFRTFNGGVECPSYLYVYFIMYAVFTQV